MLLTIVALIGALVAITLATFIIRRQLHFNRYIRESNVPFLPIRSYFKGGLPWVINSRHSLAERIDHYFNVNNGATYANFIGPVPYVYTKDLDLIQMIFVKLGHQHTNRAYLGSPTPHDDVSLLQARDNQWRRTRRAIGSAMTPSKLKLANVERDIGQCIDSMLASLKRRSTRSPTGAITLDLSLLFKTFTMDAFLTFGFDQPHLIDYDLEANDIVLSAKDMMKKAINPVVIWTLYIHSLATLVRWLIFVLKLNKFVDDLNKSIEQILDRVEGKQRVVGPDRKLIHALLDLYREKRITKNELLSNTFFLLAAGWDTTADTLTAVMWELAHDIQSQERLRDDLMRDGLDSKQLDWTLKETLRLHPPAMTGRELNDDLQWNDMKLMKGMFVILCQYSVHRDESIWGPDAKLFKPERWQHSDSHHPAQYLPFGLGPRNCAGYHLAMYELRAVTARLLLNYKIRPSDATPSELILKEGTGTVYFANIIRDPVLLELVPL